MKAAIYSRKSKFTGKGESIGNQIQLCKDHCDTLLKDKNITDFLVYEDEGFSGKNTNRPEFKRLLEDAKLGKFNILICYRIDRISRNVADFSNTLELLQKYGIDFISVREQFDTSSPMGRAMIYIASVFAQLERETIAERIKDNMLELSKTGRWLGGTPPIGYDSELVSYLDENMKERSLVKLKQVPHELKTVKLLYDKYLEFNSLSKVETYTLQNNIKTKKGSNFTKSNIRIVLTNPVYVKADDKVLEYLEGEGITICGTADSEHGLLTYNKSKSKVTVSGKSARIFRIKSEWIAAVSSQKGIIEAEDWLQVQQILEKNKNKFPNEGKTHNAILTGKLICAVCGSKMQIAHGHPSSKSGKKTFYYICTMKKHSKGILCANKNVKVDEVDNAVLNELNKLIKDKRKLINTISILDSKQKDNTSPSDRKFSIKDTISEKEKQIDNLITRLSLNDDIADLLTDKIRILTKEIACLKFELNKINKSKPEFNEFELTSSFSTILTKMDSIITTFTLDEKKKMVEALIENVIWNGNELSLQINFKGKKGLFK